jgi:hypothetical protein
MSARPYLQGFSQEWFLVTPFNEVRGHEAFAAILIGAVFGLCVRRYIL